MRSLQKGKKVKPSGEVVSVRPFVRPSSLIFETNEPTSNV